MTGSSSFDGIVGRSDALTRVLAQVHTVARTDSTVLIYGETGTAKNGSHGPSMTPATASTGRS